MNTKKNLFAIRLKTLRESVDLVDKIGMSQQEFADDFGVSQSTVGGWESGKREPDFDRLIRLADYFHVSIDSLLGRAPLPSTAVDWDCSHVQSEIQRQNIQNAHIILGMTKVHLQDICENRATPTISEIIRLSELLKCDIDYLLGRLWHPDSASLSGPEQTLLYAYRAADPADVAIFDNLASRYTPTENVKRLG